MVARFYQTGRQRRVALERARRAVAVGDLLLVMAVLVLLPGFAWSGGVDALPWAARSVAMMGLVGMGVLRLLLAMLMAPRQVTGAAVDAMAQRGPHEGLVLFEARPVEVVSLLTLVCPPARTTMLARRARVRISMNWRRVWRRSTLLPLMGSLIGRACFLPRRMPEPSS